MVRETRGTRVSFSRETSKRGGIRVKAERTEKRAGERGGEMGIRRWLREEMVESESRNGTGIGGSMLDSGRVGTYTLLLSAL